MGNIMSVSALSASVVFLASAASASSEMLPSDLSLSSSPEDMALDKLAKLSASSYKLAQIENNDESGNITTTSSSDLIGKSMQSSEEKGRGEGPFAKKAEQRVNGKIDGPTCYVNTVSTSKTQAFSLQCEPGEQPNRNYTDCVPCEA